MRTFFSLVIFVSIIFLLVHVSMFLQKHSNALGEIVENSNDLIKNSNALLVKNDENITVSIENIANLLEKSDSLITQFNSILLEADEHQLIGLLNDEKLSKDLLLTLENIRELSDLILTQLKEKGIKIDAAVL